jgi:putative transposase
MNLTYKFSSDSTNAVKLTSIKQLAPVYQEYYNRLVSKSISDYYREGSLPKFLPVIENFSNENFSERYKQTCGKQVKSNIESLLSNTKNRIANAITNSSLDKDTKIILYYVNKYHLWFKKSVTLHGNEVPQELLKLSRRLFKQYKGNTPKLRNITMCLDTKIATIEKSNNSFDYWIKLSTLDKGNPIYLPIRSYDYFKNAAGVLQKQVQIIVKKDLIEYGFVKESKNKESKCKDKIVGIDLGMVVLLASSNGNQYGQRLYKQLQHYDKIITRATRKRQRNGLKNKSDKSDRLYSKVKNLIKNEVGRVLNRFLEKEKPDIVVMENLTGLTQNTKENKKLSRKMRRLLNNCGISKIPKRLEIKSKRKGFGVDEENPAETSAECSICHYIDKKNRKDQAHFECLRCGYKRNADYVGSVNIRDRRSIPEIDIYTPYKAVRGLIEKHYLLIGQSFRHRPNYRPAVASG